MSDELLDDKVAISYDRSAKVYEEARFFVRLVGARAPNMIPVHNAHSNLHQNNELNAF